MADYFLVERAKGPDWDHSRRRREQDGWDAHATYMDALADEGVVLLAGPIGEGDGENALLVMTANSEDEIRARLADDPWGEEKLRTVRISRWNVFLGANRL